jgi:hypothetical protein
MVPSNVDTHLMIEERLPSSWSDATPEKLTGIPDGSDAPVAGDVITTEGGVFADGAVP